MPGLRLAFVLAVAIALSGAAGPAFAQTGVTREARLEGTASIAREGADASVAIDILRWSTDEEVEEMLSVLEDGTEAIEQHLRDAPTLGYVWTAESVGYSIRYATTRELEGGGARMTLALNGRFASRNPTLWESEAEGDTPYTIIELRINAGGTGEGRNVLPRSTAYAFGFDGYELAQVLLENMARVD